MPKVTKICKVCGREYEACRSQSPNLASTFRWQDVACSPECGAEYLRRVMIARGEIALDSGQRTGVQDNQEQPVKKTRRKRAAASAEGAKSAE